MKKRETKTLKDGVSANAKDEGLTWKSVLPGGVAGALIAGVVLFLAYKINADAEAAAALTGAAASDPLVEIVTLVGMVAGGFIAAYIAKGGREGLSKCIVASFISGFFVGGAVLVMGFLDVETIIEAAGEEAEIYMLYMLSVTAIVAVIAIALSVIGGVICAFLTGSKESVLNKAFKEARKAASLEVLVPALVFMLVGVGIQLVTAPIAMDKIYEMEATDATQIIIAALVIALVMLAVDVAFMAFALSAAIGGVLEKRDMTQAFKDAVRNSRHVFVSTLVFLLVAPFALLYLLPYLQLPLVWVFAMIGIYLLFVSFVAPIAFIRKEYVHCAKHSFEFIKEHALITIALYSVVFVIALLMVIATVLLLSYTQNEMVTAVVSTTVITLALVMVSSSQTALYSAIGEESK